MTTVILVGILCLALILLLALGSRFATVLRLRTLRSSVPGRPPPDHSGCGDTERLKGHPRLTLRDDVLIDILARYSEAIVSNIDAIDTALIGILALPVAFGVFAVDKIQELRQPYESVAVALLTLSALVSFIGYGWGFLIHGGQNCIRDGVYPRRFLAQYTSRGSEAIREAIGALNDAGDQNAAIRRTKRCIALVALISFLVAAVTVFAARLAW